MPAPRVFTIPPGANFLATLARTMLDGTVIAGLSGVDGPLGLAAATIYVPTRRAARLLAFEIVDAMGVPSVLLPRIVPLGLPDEAETIGLFQAAETSDRLSTDLPPAIGEIPRRLLLTRLVLQWGKSVGRAVVSIDASGRRRLDATEPLLVATEPADAWALAGELATLIDEMLIEGVDWRELTTFGQGIHDEYWRITLDFLGIAMDAWPAILAERGVIDAAARQVALIEREIARLEGGAARGPLIVAGSTGTNRATAGLMAAIARAAQGAVVLPGLDIGLDDESWLEIGQEGASGHPQAALRRLLPILGVRRDGVRELGSAPPPLRWRETFVREALRPARTTTLWQSRAARLGDPEMAAALNGLAMIEAPDERLEALALALVLREAIEQPGRTAALITPDRGLARRVVAELRRWDIHIGESAGVPLARSPAGTLARLVVACFAGGSQPLDVLALLNHPLARLGRDRAALRPIVEALEIGVMRGPAASAGGSVVDRIAAAREAACGRDAHRAQNGFDELMWRSIAGLLTSLEIVLAPLAAIPGEATVGTWVQAHLAALQAVAGGTGGGTLPPGRDSEALVDLIDEIAAASLEDLQLDASGYAAFFDRLATEAQVHGTAGDHPRLKILGLLEARLIAVDVAALGGLDESIWPPQARTDAFLNRPMREELGLTPPERRIGQTAHDFSQALGASRVVLSRALKRGGAPTVASRLVQRMAAVAGAAPWARCRAAGDRYLAWAQALDRAAVHAPITPPQPKPPLALRPRKLSVTRIEKLRRDPYSVYAESILRLGPLEPIAVERGAREFGTTLHEVLSEFVQAWPNDFLPPTAAQELLASARRRFAGQFDDAEFQVFQWPRIERNLDFFLRWERQRRGRIVQIHDEVRGVLEIPLASGEPFTLSAVADRIEIGRDGRLTIVDFKTGSPPSNREVAAGFAPQLTLEAAMAARGGFQGFAAGRDVAEGIYLKLGTSGEGGEEQVVTGPDGTSYADLGRTHYEALVALLDEFGLETRAYPSRPFPKFVKYDGDYDHLARVREWSLFEQDIWASQ